MKGPEVDALVSVIIPCYRQAHLLPNAIDSVLQQSYTGIEILVVGPMDDDDNTAEIALSYGDPVRYLRRTNEMLAAARNTGVKAARGTYLLFLDADDLLHPDAIAWLVDAIEGSDRQIALMGYRLFESSPLESENNVRRDFLPSRGTTAFPSLIHGNFGPPHSFLSPRKMVLEVGGFNEDLRSCACEDWDLWTRLALAGARFLPVSRIGAYYRRYEGSMSTKQRHMLKARTEVLLDLNEAMVQRPELLSRYGEELLEAHRRVLRRLLVVSSEKELVEAMIHAIRRLHCEGVADARPFLRRIADRCPGQWSEKLTLLYFRLCDTERYLRYSEGVN